MSLFRLALGRFFAALLALALLSLSLGALSLARQHHAARSAALDAPPPDLIPLGALPPDTPPLAEVNLRAAIAAAVDVALPVGNGRLYLLADPARPTAAPQAALLVPPSDLAAAESLIAQATLGTAQGGGPVIALNGTLSTPIWIRQAEAAAADAHRPLAADMPFIRPFYDGRAAGLAPSPLDYAVPAVCFSLFLAFMAVQVAQALRLNHARHVLRGLSQLDAQVEKMAVASADTAPEGMHWATLAARRSELRQRRQRLEAQLHRGRTDSRGPWLWVGLIVAGGAAGLVPQRLLSERVASHLLGADLTGLLARTGHAAQGLGLDSLAALPGDLLAQGVLLLLGPQSIGLAGTLRMLPVTVWIALLAILVLVLQRRAENRRAERGHLR
ncbi:hypothetical protein [Paragemmobacter straminiformis]|uniref:Uncharacterized protein n=1 Tax=Paragemmobacter straminiformis TaxID=2045119 RepID=A0A842ICW6_9RHOB|nr:hypothetical protein [Gemmobacter straminiformis]MBC2836934.1 hypothetical protein [Gemmobacter straminiformis]